MTIEEVIKKFSIYAQQFDETAPNKNWYVGITQQEPATIRKKQHEDEKNIQCRHFKPLVTVKNKKSALHIEKELEKAGFAIHEKDLELIQETASAQAKKIYVYIYQAVQAKKN